MKSYKLSDVNPKYRAELENILKTKLPTVFPADREIESFDDYNLLFCGEINFREDLFVQ